MAEVIVALFAFFLHDALHAGAVIGMKGVAFDVRRVDPFAPEDLIERVLDRCGARTGRTGNGNNGMCYRHSLLRLPLELRF